MRDAIEVLATIIVAAWALAGLTLAGIIFWKDGFPDYETYDGPAIPWGTTFAVTLVCVVGAPFWCWLAIQEHRRAPAPIPHDGENP